jgi:hypothetical protein
MNAQYMHRDTGTATQVYDMFINIRALHRIGNPVTRPGQAQALRPGVPGQAPPRWVQVKSQGGACSIVPSRGFW